MSPFRLIKGTALHICSYRRLLVWHLLACCIYTSCSTQVKDGFKSSTNSNQVLDKDKKPWLQAFTSLIKSKYIKSKKNSDLFSEIEKYCDPNLNPRKQSKIEAKIKKLIQNCNNDYIISQIITDKNPLYTIVESHSINKESSRKKKFLEEVIGTIVRYYSYLANDWRKVNKETPLHLAIQKGNLPMVKILLPYTNLFIKNTDTPIFLHYALAVYFQSNLDPETEKNIEESIEILSDSYANKGYFNSKKNIDSLICFVDKLPGWKISNDDHTNDTNFNKSLPKVSKEEFIKKFRYNIKCRYTERLI